MLPQGVGPRGWIGCTSWQHPACWSQDTPHSCCPAMGSPGQCFSTELQSNGSWRVKMPSFCKEVLSSLLSLPTGRPLGTHKPPTTLDQQYCLSPLLGMPATAWLQATTDTGSILAPLTLSVSDTPVHQPDIKWCCRSSDQGMPNPGQDEEEAPDDMPEDPPARSKSQW